MTYQKDGLVQAADYNTYVGVDPSSSATGFNTVYATGSGRSGYGQLAIPRVLLNNTVTASEWRALINNMVNVASHQGTTFDTMSLPSTNDLIAAISTTTSPILSLFDLNLPRLYNNRNNAVAQGSLQNYPRTSTTTFSDNLVFTHTITFESGDKARYFFNAGGQISVNFSHPNGTGMNQLWNSLATACGKLTISTHNSGTITIAGNTYTGLSRTNGSGTPNILVTDSGYHSLLNENKTIFKQFATVGPDSNSLQSYIDVIISTNGTQQANGDAGSILYITTRFVQAGTSQVSAAGSTVTCTVTPPSTTYLQNTWGSIGVTSDCIATNSSVIEPPVIVIPPVVTPSNYRLNWTSNNPDFGTNNTLVATLDLVATTDMTLTIPYTSTIAGVPAGIANISITKGQLTGRTTLNLFGATAGGQGGTVTTNSGTLSIASTPSNISLSLIGGNQAFTMSPDLHGTFTYTSDKTITVPPGITKISFIVVGAGGGAGAGDVSGVGPGNNGLPGKKLVGDLTVVPGDTLNFYIGSGGTGGVSRRDGKKTHAYGGTNSYSGNVTNAPVTGILPTSGGTGYYTRTNAINNDPVYTGTTATLKIRQWWVVINGVTVYNSTTAAPTQYSATTYQGSAVGSGTATSGTDRINTFNLKNGGGSGGEAGLLNISGQGGGGGAATVIVKNGTLFAIAAGGGGGGGSGNGGKGVVRTKTEYTLLADGEKANDGPGDGSTGGGGGGGELGGKAGLTAGSDTGSPQGSQGKSKLPTGWVESNGTNGAVSKNITQVDNGGNGYVTITY